MRQFTEHKARQERGRKQFGRRSRFNRGESRGFGKQMHTRTCAKCGKESEVPFKPTNNKPVYCRDCFNSGAEHSGSRRSDDHRRQSSGLDEINEKLDKIMRALKIE